MATATVKTFKMFANMRATVLTVSGLNNAGQMRTISIDTARIDAIEMTDAEQSVYYAVESEAQTGKGEQVECPMTSEEMNSLVSVRNKIAEANDAPIAPETPEIIPPAPVAPVIVPTPVAPVAPVLASMEHHTATVEGAECEDDEEYTGGPKKRNRKKDERVRAIAKSVTARMRGIGLDEMERRVSQLEKAAQFFNDDIEELQYDVPTAIRAETPEPVRVIRSVGGVMTTESTGLVKEKDIPLLSTLFAIWDEYAEGTPNAIRLGCFVEYDHVGVAFKSKEKLKRRVSRTTDKLLRQLHTTLIKGIATASDTLNAAMKSEDVTLNAQEKAQCARDNAVRAALVIAAEKLNVALMHVEAYDTTEETRDLFKGIRATIESQRNTFNADCIKRGAKGVDI